MGSWIDIAGLRFGKWAVLSYAGKSKWRCRCECSTEADVAGYSLRNGCSFRCAKCVPRSLIKTKHGGKRTRLYNIWCKMKARCGNENEGAYPRYGGRGIKICKEWGGDFSAFRDWALANGYQKSLTIDRKNNDGHYEPGNCRWATYAEQSRNYSRNRPLLFNGRYVIIADLAAEYGLPQDVVKNRIRRYGWPIERALSTPVAKRAATPKWAAAGKSPTTYYRHLKQERDRCNIDALPAQEMAA